MGSDGGDDERIAFPVVEEFLGVGEGLGERFIVWRGKIDDGFTEDAAHACFFGGAGDGVFEVVHVRVSGGAAAQHFQDCQARAPDGEVFGDVARFGGKYVIVQPLVERQIIGDAAKQAHGGVGVAVDEAGDY